MTGKKPHAAKRSTHNRTVGPCPACRSDVVAELDVATFLGDVTMDDQGAPQVSVRSEVTAARVIHRCQAAPGAPAVALEPPTAEPAKPAKKAAGKRTAKVGA